MPILSVGAASIKARGTTRDHDMSFCGLGRSYDRFYLIRDVADWWPKLDFKFWQQTNNQGRRFVS